MKKLISLILSMILAFSLIPVVASAASNSYKDYTLDHDSWFYVQNGVRTEVNDQATLSWLWANYCGEMERILGHEPGKHKYSVKYNNKYHWLGCPCGCQISMEPHVDPKDAENDYCTCGFHFSSNADLVTLWVDGCPCIKDFNKNTTEYTLEAYTYKDVKEVKISTRTADSQATVELPEDLTLKEGENVIPVKVTAGNQRDTKTYTLTIIKEST